MNTEIERLSAENDEAVRIWTEAHKHDPCERCGATEGVTIHPAGSLARLTPLCAACLERLQLQCKAWHQGFAAGNNAFRQLPWWRRLFGPA